VLVNGEIVLQLLLLLKTLRREESNNNILFVCFVLFS